MIRQIKDPRLYRYQMVLFAKEHGVNPTARESQTTPPIAWKILLLSQIFCKFYKIGCLYENQLKLNDGLF